MNREEFIGKYSSNPEEMELISFLDKEHYIYTTLSGDPKDYVDIAPQFINLKNILLEGAETLEYYKSISKFLKNSNDDVSISNGPVGEATKEEFYRSEEIINSIIDEINPEWSAKQKAACVHYKMGEIISYMPDCTFNNKVGNQKAKDSRNIWKSVDSGISVCNGIAQINRNILSRVGVKTQELSSGTHEFIMIETVEGNIITDPTWDLSNTLFEGRPMYFGKTYEQLRQIDGPLSKAHRLENPPENIAEISVEELREIYKSIGIAKEDGSFKFPILDKVNQINNQQFESENEKVQAFLQMFTQNFSKQATHLTETRTMLERCMPALGIDEKNFTTKFVYVKDDKTSEKPYLCIHINGEEMNRTIAVLNTEKMRFENLNIQDFDELYRQHEEDTREPFWKKYLQREEVTRETEQDKSEK